MSTFTRPSGLQVTLPPTHRLVEPVAPGPLQRRRPLARTTGPIPLPSAKPADDAALVAALREQEMELVDELELVAEPLPTGQRRGPALAAASTELTLPLAVHEDAVVLLEADGMYTWQLAEETGPAPTNRKRGQAAAGRIARFRLPLGAQVTPAGATRKDATRGFFGDVVLDKVKAFVFRFAARVVVGSAIKFLERRVQRGLVDMSSPDPANWRLFERPDALALPRDRPARVLLFVHGTFSSTVGGYGGLAATPWGQAFLQAAHTDYDAVIGFDHATLSEDPLENASDLLTALQAVNWPQPPLLDVITHSRGGLVVRCLREHLLPLTTFAPRFDRVVFVAVTNGGTLLAEPSNWHALMDLYTNLAVAAGRLIGMMPQAKGAAVVLTELVKGVGALVKYCATTAVTDRQVPGLAAMEPDGAFITRLNEAQPNQPSVEQSYYCTITSEFVPRVIGGDHEPQELPKRLLLGLAGSFIAQLMKEANDLVVNTASMTRIDPLVGQYVKDRLDFGVNPQVYHTNYFVRPEVVNALTRWLRLKQPTAPVVASGSPVRSLPRGVKTALPPAPITFSFSRAPHPDLIGLGGFARSEVPAAVDTDVLLMSAQMPLGETLAQIEDSSPSYVVVRRQHAGEQLHYAFTAEEMLRMGTGKSRDSSLLDALNLHEWQRSPTRLVSDALEPLDEQPDTPASVDRLVVLAGSQAIGVLPARAALPNATELVALARTAVAPRRAEDFIVTRRTMPTFAAAPEALAGELPPLAAPRPRKIVRSTGGGPRRSPGDGPIAAAAASPKPRRPKAAPKVTCRFRAEMEQEVALGRPTTVEITISQDAIGKALHAAAAEGQADLDPTRQLVIQVLPKTNFESVDDGWTTLDPPTTGEPQLLYFILRATQLGEGEVWVVARQGQVPLVTLVLRVQVVKKVGESRTRTLATATTAEAPKLSAPLHQLTIMELRRADGEIYYRYQLQSPTLQLLKQVDSKPILGDRQAYVAGLYKGIEMRWLSNQQDVADFTEELREFGATMFDELIPAELQADLWNHRADIQSIMVIAEEPFIPWELVHLKAPGQTLPPESCFLGQMGLVRWLYGSWPTEQLRLRPGKTRYVIPQYPHPDYVLPEAEKEADFLQASLGATAVEPTSAAVRALLQQPGTFDLLHFACHGAAESDNITDARLLLQGRIEQNAYLPDNLTATTVETRANLRAPDGKAPLIVLNACQAGRAGYKLTGIGGFAQAFIKRGAALFIGTLWSVGDQPARSFTEEFYRQLLAGRTVAEATIAAREAARVAGDATWLAYAVYGHPHARLVG